MVDHIAESVQPLAEVRDRVVEDIRFTRGSALTEKAGKEVLEDLRSGKSFETIATDRNITWQNAEGISRTDVQVNRAILRTAFRLGKSRDNKPLYDSVAMGTGDFAVIALLGAHDPEPDSIKEVEIKNIQKQIQAMRSAISWQQFLADIKRKADIQTFEDRL